MAFVTFALCSCNFANILWMAGKQGLRISYLQECLFYHAIIRIINAVMQPKVWLKCLEKDFFSFCLYVLHHNSLELEILFFKPTNGAQFFPIMFAEVKLWTDILLTFFDILYRTVFNWDWDLSVQAVATELIIKVHVFFIPQTDGSRQKEFCTIGIITSQN